jgi:hypothetical protein
MNEYGNKVHFNYEYERYIHQNIKSIHPLPYVHNNLLIINNNLNQVKPTRDNFKFKIPISLKLIII